MILNYDSTPFFYKSKDDYLIFNRKSRDMYMHKTDNCRNILTLERPQFLPG